MLLDRQSYAQATEDLCGLFERSFGKRLPASFLRWRYLDNPFGELLVNVELGDDGRLAANYSVSPVHMRIHSGDARTALSMTTMTDPAYAGRGLFTRLAEELYDAMMDRAFTTVWGFPNRNSHHGFVNRLGWVDVYEIPTMRASLADVRVERSVVQRDDNFELDYVSLSEPAEIFVPKSTEYLRWRYADHPLNAYANIVLTEGARVSAFCVVKRYGDDLDVVDFQAPDPDRGRELLRDLLAHATQEGAVAISCWAPRHHFMHSLFERAGFANGGPVTYFGFRQLRGTASRSISTDYSDWFLQMGDSDVY